jgi:DNA-binding winged helix-turn-helix (wHTH) protein
VSAFRVGEWLVEPTLNSLSKSDSTVRLEPKVMQVLVCLAEHAGKVISKDRLLQRVWPGTFVTEDVLTRAISELRHVFGDDPKHARFIQTIPKGGYRLVVSVTPTSAPIEDMTAAARGTPDSVMAVGTGHLATHSVSIARGFAAARSALARYRRIALLAVAVAVMLGAGTWQTWRWLWPRPAAITGARPLTRSGDVMFPDRWLMNFPGLATDGTRVYYTQGAIGPSWGEKLAQVSLVEGTTAIVPRHLSRVRLRDSRIERLVDYVDVTRGTLMTCVGPTGVDLDGSPLLHCFVSASELHGLDLALP